MWCGVVCARAGAYMCAGVTQLSAPLLNDACLRIAAAWLL